MFVSPEVPHNPRDCGNSWRGVPCFSGTQRSRSSFWSLWPSRRCSRSPPSAAAASTSPGSDRHPHMSGRAPPPAKLLSVVAPVSLVGIGAYLAACFAFARDPGSTTVVLGGGAFLVASTLTERFPVPVEGADANGVSLGFVFAVAALVLFGWAPATFVYATAPTLVALGRRNPPIRTIFNAGVFGLTGAIAGWVLVELGPGSGPTAVLARVTVTAVI